uniref:Heat shock protein 70 n=1 Tax=Mesocestoides corti TaxID=53468 RepID=A0A5K3G8E9_MESCO
MRNKEYEVVRSVGDVHLGGGDIDTRLFQHFQAKLGEMRSGKLLKDDARAVWRLRKACESVKKQLSVEERGYIEVDNLLAGVDFHASISRAEFEHLCADIFKKTMEITERCLVEAGMTAADIDEVVLVGGSTRIPKVRRLIEEYFGAEKVRHSINPDEAVALGAVVQASI